MSLVIDASVYVSAARPSEPQHVSSKQFLRMAEDVESLYAPVLLLTECAAAIIRATFDAVLAMRVRASVEASSVLSLVPISLALAQRAADIAVTCRLRAADAIYIAVAQYTGAEAISWDGEVLQRGSAVVRTRTPAQWLEEHSRERGVES